MAAETLSFSSANGQFESDWFQPNAPFQLDLVFGSKVDNATVRVYSDNDYSETERANYALATEFVLRDSKHLNAPVLKVIEGAGVYYKVACTVNPSSGSYLTA